MKRIQMVSATVVMLALLSGCAGLIKSNVTVFHQLSEEPSPKTYVFFPIEGQKNNLEYKTYQRLVRQQLAKHQYREASPADKPDVVIAFNYGIDSGKEKLTSIPIYGQTGISSSTTYGTLSTYGSYGTYSGTTTYTPTYGVVGSSTVSRTEYSRSFWLWIVDAKTVGTDDLNILYQGDVRSSGRSSQLSPVIPAMVEALFKEFPGESGKSRTEIIPRQ